MWGVLDLDAELRRAVSGTMLSPGAGVATRQRFAAALARLGIPAEEWDGEWAAELAVFAGSLRGGRGPPTRSKAFLSDVHCFVLANVLRRPLVIYGSAVALSAGLAGVYLPLLWAGARGPACSRVPTCLLFRNSHFSVLATREGDGEAAALHLRPLPRRGAAAQRLAPAHPRDTAVPSSATRLPLAICADGCVTQLPVRFLLPDEEANQRELLRAWMDLVPDSGAPGIPHDVLAFWLPPKPPDASLS